MPETIDNKDNLKKQSVMYGLIAALIFVSAHTIAYTMGVEAIVSFSFVGAFVPVVIGLLVYGAFQIRKQQGDVLTFKDALQFAFLAYVIFELINAVFVYLLYTVIDPTLTQSVFDATLERMELRFEKMGMSGDQLDDALEKARQETPKTGVKEIFMGLGFSLIFSFVKSLIIAIIARREPKIAFDQL